MQNEIRFEIEDENGAKKSLIFNIEEQYNSLSPKVFRSVFKLLTRGHKKFYFKAWLGSKRTEMEKLREIDPLFPERVELLHLVGGIPKDILTDLNIFQITNLFEAVDFFGTTANINLLESKVPKLGIAKGPTSALDGDEMNDLIELAEQVTEFNEKGTVDVIDDMIANLYKPFGIRLKGTAFKIWKGYVSRFMPLHKKLSAFFNCVGLLNNFSKRFPLAHGGDESGQSNHFRWRGVIVSLAGDKFGTVEDVRKTNPNDCFIYLEENQREYLRMKEDS